MESQQVDLGILLWAISWNVQELISNPTAHFMQTSLMVSNKLPLVLSQWHKPPQTHSTGTRTKAAGKAMTSWALELICDDLDQEMHQLKLVMDSPQQELSEASLLGIDCQEMINDIKLSTPTMWTLFCCTAYTAKQELRNMAKNPDPVKLPDVYS
jgi:hypothetical protein